MGGNFVEQKDWRLTAPVGHQIGMGKDETKEQRFVFAGRRARRYISPSGSVVETHH